MTDPLAAPQLLNRLRMRQVALLTAVQRHGTLGAAAAQLGMTQPAATKMLHELEATLGCLLFTREGRGLRPTPAGQTVMTHFDGLNGSIEALARDLNALQRGGAGRLCLGSILASSPAWLTDAVAQLKRELPMLELVISIETSNRLMEQLERGELDLVIGRLVEGYTHADYECELLDGEPLSVVVGPQHPLAAQRGLALADLAGQPWILQPRGSPMREVLEREFRLQGLDAPLDRVETASIMTTTSLLAVSQAVAVMPTSVAAPYASHGMVVILPVKIVQQLEPFNTIVRRGRPLSAAAQRFLALLRPPARPPAAPLAASPAAT
jgi:DNA-binding transcriptional LysR family regulator